MTSKKFVRSEECKRKRRVAEKLKRMDAKVKEFLTEEENVPMVFLYVTAGGRIKGQVSPLLKDIAIDFAKKVLAECRTHDIDVLPGGEALEMSTDLAKKSEDLKEMLQCNFELVGVEYLRKILPIVVKKWAESEGFTVKKGALWGNSELQPPFWPSDVPFQDPNNPGKKLAVVQIRKVLASFQEALNLEAFEPSLKKPKIEVEEEEEEWEEDDHDVFSTITVDIQQVIEHETVSTSSVGSSKGQRKSEYSND